jgi:hypothetical protein
MDFRFTNLKRLLLFAGTVAVFSCAQAQSVTRPGLPIIFSSPDGGNAASNAPTLSAPTPIASGLPDAVRPSLFNLGVLPPRNVDLPAPQAVVASPGDFQRLQKLLDERKNWALLTPAEILGITTPEKILQAPDNDAADQEKNATAEERYLERQDQLETGRTNGYPSDPSSRWDFSGDQDNRLGAGRFNNPGGDFGNSGQPAGMFPNTAPNNASAANPNENAGWSGIFAAPTPAPSAPSPEQQAEMERFQELLNPQPQSSIARSTADKSIFSSPQTTPNSIFGQSAASPVGGSFTPLNSGIGGVPISPFIPIQNSTPQAVTPSWTPQLPPWMSPVPQPGVIPQRKF